MTRINSGIPVKSLTDEHLLAEHREIKRLPYYIRRIVNGEIKNSGADADPTHCTIYVDGVKQEALPVVFN